MFGAVFTKVHHRPNLSKFNLHTNTLTHAVQSILYFCVCTPLAKVISSLEVDTSNSCVPFLSPRASHTCLLSPSPSLSHAEAHKTHRALTDSRISQFSRTHFQSKISKCSPAFVFDVISLTHGLN